MPLLSHIGMVSVTERVKYDDVARVSAALQKQVLRDFAPIWGIESTVDAFARVDDVPVDYWKVFIIDGDTGSQHTFRNNQPYALVASGRSWSLLASHEVLEMLADPFALRMVAGQSPMPEQGRVEFLVEVCDPCQNEAFAYTINGLLVSDFYTPNYFDPVRASGVRYSFRGELTEPHQVLKGGYLTWREPTSGNWFQESRNKQSKRVFKSLRQIAIGATGARGAIDQLTPPTMKLANLPEKSAVMKRATRALEAAERAAIATAKLLTVEDPSPR